MATAIYVAERALRLILVQASDSELEADEYQDFYDAMNDYMAALEADGVNLGYTTVTGPEDVITIPDGCIRGLIANMAVEVAPDYEATVSASLAVQARRGMNTMLRLGRKSAQTQYPQTLPIGSGNYYSTYDDNSHYRAVERALITLTNNTSATKIAAVDTPVLVAGFWETAEASGVSADISGRIQNRKADNFDLNVVASLEVTGGSAITVHLYENGNESLKSVSGVADGSLITLRHSTILKPNEFLELWIENDDDTTDLVVRDCQFQIS